MVGKNNNYVRESKSNEHFQRFALRKLSVGVVSVAVAAGFYLGSGATAQAATTESNASAKTEQVVQQNSTSAASDSTSTSNSSAAVSTSSATPVSTESASSMTVSDLPASASAASDNQASAANASESSSQSASSSVASDAAATVSKDSQAASEANSQSAADVETVQLLTLAANANANESQAANILGAQAVQKAADQQAPAGFTVTDPNYPAEMYKDPDASHYTYWWAQSSNGEYNLVLSTDRNGDGKVYVFLLGNNNNVLGKYTVDKNKSTEVATDDEGDFGTVYNDGQSGVFVTSDGTWKSRFNVFDPKAGEDDGDYGSISFMIPQVETQTTIYVTYFDSKGNKVDKPIEVSDLVIQKGLDGQIYTTKGGKVINGYFAKEPKNAHGFMSPFGKQGAIYTKDWHDGLKATFTETDTKTGLMHVVVKHYYHNWGWGTWRTVKEFDLAPGQSEKVDYDVYKSVTIHSIYIPQTINIQYTYEKLGNLVISSDSKSFPAEDKTQYPNDKSDSTKAGNVTIPKVAGFTPTINDKTVTNYTFNPSDYVSDLSKDINVVYVADTQEAAISFYDETDHKPLNDQTIQLTGKTGEKISHTEANQTLAKLGKQGYVVDQNTFADDATYDNDTQAPQEFTIYLKHGTTHTDATSSKADQKTVSETIHYVYKDGVNANKPAADDANTTVTFKRGYTTDKVTGKIVSYDPWTVDGKQADSKTFDAVKSPAIEGYTPNHSQIDEITVTPDSKDVVKTVVYVGNAQEAQAIFYDETTGKEISGTREIATGKTDETISFTKDPNEVVKELEKQGYVFDKDNAKNNVFVAGTAYDKNSEVHQYFKYYLKHGHATVTPDQDPQKGQKTVTQTIKYEYADGTATGLADNVQTLTFKRTGDKDLVTHEVTWPDWSTVAGQQTSVVTSPALNGYTADTNEIPAITYHAGDSDVTYVVKYNADVQHAVINYIDGESDEILHTDKVNGHSDEKINYSTADMIKQLEAKGYELFKDNFPAGEKFDNDDKNDQTYTVIFKHHRENVDPNHSSADGTKGTKTLTETVHYKYADGTKAAEDQTAQVTFTRNGVLDDVTGIVAWGKWNEASQSYKALTSPTIAGYTPSEAVVKRSSNSDAEQGPTLTVIYTADAQTAYVKYVDDTTGETLRQDDLHGYTDETIPYSTAEGIKKFEGDGYELFKDNFPAGEKFDNDDKNDQTYTVIFKHHRENVDPNHSSADGTKGTKTLTETVHYKYADGTKAAEDQTAQVTFTRNGVLDDVTGIVAWGKWNEASQSYKALTSPTIAGYTPSEAVVKRSSNSDAEQGPTLTVIYTADAQTAYVKYVDDTTGETLRQDDLHGYTDETIPYSTAEGIKKFEGDGYELFKDNFPAGEKFDNDDKNDQTYTVIFKHHRENVDPNHSSADGTKGTKTLTETVHYKYADGTKAAEDQTAQVTFTRNGVLDDVTGIVAWGKWNEASQSYKALTSPTIAGYTPSEAVVKRSSNSDAEQGPTLTVIYTADAQTAYVKYVDDTTGETLRQDDLHGYTDETIPYSTAEGIKKYEGDGYVLVSDGFKPGTKFGVGTPTYEVHFKHGTTHTDATDENADQKTVTETIHYVDENNQTVQPDSTTAVTFKRGYTTDNVTGKVVSYDPWTVDGNQADSKTFAAVPSPAVEGYTPNHQQINEFTVTPDSKDIVKTVVYVGDPQEAQAIFYDETTGKEISNTREIVNGKTDETIGFTKDPNEVVKELEKQGYVFDKDNANNNVFAAGTTYDKNSEVHQYFKYYFTHATTIVTPDNPKTPADVLPDNPGKNYPSGVAKDDLNKTVTRTINITTPDGKTQTITQKAEFTRSATVDEVTGEVTYGPWSKNVVLESVDVPNIPGYVPSASVPEITVTPNDQDMTINITYKKLDSGKTTDQNGNASNGGSTTDQTVQNGQAGQTQNNTDVQNAQQLPQTGNANNEKSVLGLASAMFAAGLGLGFGSKKKRHED